MQAPGRTDGVSDHHSYDAVIVGGSLAGCATATMLAREGARVAVVEKSPDPTAFKRICSHFIQASAVPTLERLDLLEPMMAAGAVRPALHMRVPWGWIEPPPGGGSLGVNLRRERLDPMVRELAAATPGVEMLLGHRVEELCREDGAIAGVVATGADGTRVELRAPLTIGADGRDSLVARLAEVKVKVSPHGRFAYGAYYEDVPVRDRPDGTAWMMDPDWAAAFPTDSGLTFCAAMPTKDRIGEFKADPEAAMADYFEALPEAPSLRSARLVSPVMGKLEMPNRKRVPTAPGLALVGDAALATDPLFGVGCGWAFQSAEWLVDSVASSLRGEESLERGLRRYRRRHGWALNGHSMMIHDYATGRKLSPPERLIFSGAARDKRVASIFERFGTRQIGPARMMATAVPLAAVANLRHSVRRRRGAAAEPAVGAGASPGSVA